ncbi:MAG: chitobiase/beta-hexosaminidase C-terminal domain-containing protein, partial [Parcubacteria group bacterium]|nr:chitobiase/beta-hexosaminidase C-terminal domain-containing protein [Parcubacteria group bacterium]
MDIKNKIKNLTLFIAIIVCGVFLFIQKDVRAQDYIWQQANTSGFDGDTNNQDIRSLVSFDGYLYAGTEQAVTGGQIWRSLDGTTWNEVVSNGFGDATNTDISSLAVFDDFIYAGTQNAAGIEVWRSENGTAWSAVVADEVDGDGVGSDENGFNDAGNTDSLSMEVYNSFLYLSTSNGPGAEIWRTSNGTTWSQINASGFGILETLINTLEGFSGNLYAGTAASRGEIWRCDSCNGGWSAVVGDGPPVTGGGGGFGDALISSISKLITFGSNIYAGTDRQMGGGQVRRSDNGTSWTQVVSGGFGDNNNTAILSAYVSNGYLYFGTSNGTTGTELWRSNDGTSWTEIVGDGADGNATGFDEDGFGDANNTVSSSMVEYSNHLYVGAFNSTDGGELWQLNYIPEGSVITALQSDDGDGKVTISFPVDDEDRDDIQAQIQYNISDSWEDPTLIGSETSATNGDPSVNNDALTYQISNIEIPAIEDNTITTVWNSASEDDIPGVSTTANLRVRYNDTISTGDWITTTVVVDNTTPNAPTLDDVESPTNIDTQTISGGKDANVTVVLTSALIADTTIIDATHDDYSETSWSYNMDLSEGVNDITLMSRDSGGNESADTTGSIILDTTAPTTEADPPGGTYVGILDEVTLTSDEAGTTIYYTTDGTDPDLDSDTYSDPFEISDNTTLKFFGVDGLDNQEAINEEVYVLVDAAVRLTKSVSVESAEVVAAAPIDFKYSGLIIPSISGGFNNLKAIAFKSLDFIKYPSYELYQKIAQVLLILLFISFSGVVFLALFKKIKNGNISGKNFIKSFEFAYSSHKKIFFGLAVFVS